MPRDLSSAIFISLECISIAKDPYFLGSRQHKLTQTVWIIMLRCKSKVRLFWSRQTELTLRRGNGTFSCTFYSRETRTASWNCKQEIVISIRGATRNFAVVNLTSRYRKNHIRLVDQSPRGCKTSVDATGYTTVLVMMEVALCPSANLFFIAAACRSSCVPETPL